MAYTRKLLKSDKHGVPLRKLECSRYSGHFSRGTPPAQTDDVIPPSLSSKFDHSKFLSSTEGPDDQAHCTTTLEVGSGSGVMSNWEVTRPPETSMGAEGVTEDSCEGESGSPVSISMSTKAQQRLAKSAVISVKQKEGTERAGSISLPTAGVAVDSTVDSNSLPTLHSAVQTKHVLHGQNIHASSLQTEAQEQASTNNLYTSFEELHNILERHEQELVKDLDDLNNLEYPPGAAALSDFGEMGHAGAAEHRESFLRVDDIPKLTSLLASVSQKWYIIGIALELPERVLRACGENGGDDVSMLTSILEAYVSGGPKTLDGLRSALATDTVGMHAVAKLLDAYSTMDEPPENSIQGQTQSSPNDSVFFNDLYQAEDMHSASGPKDSVAVNSQLQLSCSRSASSEEDNNRNNFDSTSEDGFAAVEERMVAGLGDERRHTERLIALENDDSILVADDYSSAAVGEGINSSPPLHPHLPTATVSLLETSDSSELVNPSNLNYSETRLLGNLQVEAQGPVEKQSISESEDDNLIAFDEGDISDDEEEGDISDDDDVYAVIGGSGEGKLFGNSENQEELQPKSYIVSEGRHSVEVSAAVASPDTDRDEDINLDKFDSDSDEDNNLDKFDSDSDDQDIPRPKQQHDLGEHGTATTTEKHLGDQRHRQDSLPLHNHPPLPEVPPVGNDNSTELCSDMLSRVLPSTDYHQPLVSDMSQGLGQSFDSRVHQQGKLVAANAKLLDSSSLFEPEPVSAPTTIADTSPINAISPLSMTVAPTTSSHDNTLTMIDSPGLLQHSSLEPYTTLCTSRELELNTSMDDSSSDGQNDFDSNSDNGIEKQNGVDNDKLLNDFLTIPNSLKLESAATPATAESLKVKVGDFDQLEKRLAERDSIRFDKEPAQSLDAMYNSKTEQLTKLGDTCHLGDLTSMSHSSRAAIEVSSGPKSLEIAPTAPLATTITATITASSPAVGSQNDSSDSECDNISKFDTDSDEEHEDDEDENREDDEDEECDDEVQLPQRIMSDIASTTGDGNSTPPLEQQRRDERGAVVVSTTSNAGTLNYITRDSSVEEDSEEARTTERSKENSLKDSQRVEGDSGSNVLFNSGVENNSLPDESTGEGVVKDLNQDRPMKFTESEVRLQTESFHESTSEDNEDLESDDNVGHFDSDSENEDESREFSETLIMRESGNEIISGQSFNIEIWEDKIRVDHGMKVLDLGRMDISEDGMIPFEKILKIHRDIQMLDLTDSEIGVEGAISLSQALKPCKKVEVLGLSGTKISSIGLAALCQEIEHLCSLTSLNLANNNITSDGVVTLSSSLHFISKLQILDLSYNVIDHSGIVALAGGLRYCKTFCHLNLSYVRISRDGVEALANGLQHCQNLQVLNLSCASIDSEGVTILVNRLKKSCASITTFDLSCNRINTLGAASMAEGLNYWHNIQILNLSSNDIQTEGFKALGEAIKFSVNLEVLNLSNNSIDPDGITSLSNGLRSCLKLKSLQLSSNNFGAAGMKALSYGIECCRQLKILELSHNDCQCKGLTYLAKGLLSCTKIQELNLSYNSIDSDGAVALAHSLHSCKELSILKLSNNRIGSSGAVALATAFKDSRSLLTLNLSHNSIGFAGSESLKDILKSCRNMETLDLSGNSLNITSSSSKEFAFYSESMVSSPHTGLNNLDSDDDNKEVMHEGENWNVFDDEARELPKTNSLASQWSKSVKEHSEGLLPGVVPTLKLVDREEFDQSRYSVTTSSRNHTGNVLNDLDAESGSASSHHSFLANKEGSNIQKFPSESYEEHVQDTDGGDSSACTGGTKAESAMPIDCDHERKANSDEGKGTAIRYRSSEHTSVVGRSSESDQVSQNNSSSAVTILSIPKERKRRRVRDKYVAKKSISDISHGNTSTESEDDDASVRHKKQGAMTSSLPVNSSQILHKQHEDMVDPMQSESEVPATREEQKDKADPSLLELSTPGSDSYRKSKVISQRTVSSLTPSDNTKLTSSSDSCDRETNPDQHSEGIRNSSEQSPPTVEGSGSVYLDTIGKTLLSKEQENDTDATHFYSQRRMEEQKLKLSLPPQHYALHGLSDKSRSPVSDDIGDEGSDINAEYDSDYPTSEDTRTSHIAIRVGSSLQDSKSGLPEVKNESNDGTRFFQAVPPPIMSHVLVDSLEFHHGVVLPKASSEMERKSVDAEIGSDRTKSAKSKPKSHSQSSFLDCVLAPEYFGEVESENNLTADEDESQPSEGHSSSHESFSEKESDSYSVSHFPAFGKKRNSKHQSKESTDTLSSSTTKSKFSSVKEKGRYMSKKTSSSRNGVPGGISDDSVNKVPRESTQASASSSVTDSMTPQSGSLQGGPSLWQGHEISDLVTSSSRAGGRKSRKPEPFVPLPGQEVSISCSN